MTTSLPLIPIPDEMHNDLLPEELRYNGYFSMRVAAKNIGNQSKIYYALSGVKNPTPKLLKGIRHFKLKLEDLEDIYKEMERIQKQNDYKIVPYSEPDQEFDRYYKEGDKINTHLDTVYTEMCKRYPALRNICSSIEFEKQRKLDIGAEIRNQRDKRQTEIDKRRGTTSKTSTASNAAVRKKTLWWWLGKGKKSKKSKTSKMYKKSKTHKRKMH